MIISFWAGRKWAFADEDELFTFANPLTGMLNRLSRRFTFIPNAIEAGSEPAKFSGAVVSYFKRRMGAPTAYFSEPPAASAPRAAAPPAQETHAPDNGRVPDRTAAAMGPSETPNAAARLMHRRRLSVGDGGQ